MPGEICRMCDIKFFVKIIKTLTIKISSIYTAIISIVNYAAVFNDRIIVYK
jgi:hypothetical protein